MGSTAGDIDPTQAQAVQQVLGYLNFSSGTPDPQFLRSLDQLFRLEKQKRATKKALWKSVWENLRKSLDQAQKDSAAFADTTQAKRVIDLVFEFLPAYQQNHVDLLAHQSDKSLFNSFFTGRAAEVLLRTISSIGDSEQVLTHSLASLNDYVGFRPVATLASKKIEPYAHEWVRPIPLFVADAGAATGKYSRVVEICIDLLQRTDERLLRAAFFDPDKLTELAIDPRAYDFDHPASRRPNHQFGMWDPHCIDGDGFYRRYVVQQVTIDCLLRRVNKSGSIPHDELLFEGAAVLAGTILMSSGISGYGPETHDSTVSLSGLLMRIAAYRDEFYHQLIARMDGSHGARLREEEKQLQQPFGGARQALNRELTNCRAIQLQRVHLARIYARMDYASAADEQTQLIQVPSARLNCQIDCALTEAKRFLVDNDLGGAIEAVERSRESIRRGIECGAIVDPWNILGFDANFSLFGQIENSIRDYRVDDLVVAVEEMIELYAQIWSKAVANERTELAQRVQAQFSELANWWHQFAAHEMDSVDAENPLDVYEAASNVVDALQAWHQQGEATGDIGFWAPHVQKFDSCRAYWLVVNTLLLHDDKVASLGLMMHWLSQADRIPLEHGETSFFQLTLRWLAATLKETGEKPVAGERGGWPRIRRFFDYLEANAGDYWNVPEFRLEDANGIAEPSVEGDEELDEEDDERFSAAYENVVYRDSTDDGMDGSVFDFETTSNEDYLHQMSRTILDRMGFLDQLATIWKMICVIWATSECRGDLDAKDPEISESIHELLQSALTHAKHTSRDLRKLAHSIHRYRLNRSGTDPESMVEYDRLRLMKESLLDQIITADVSVIEAMQFLSATLDEKTWQDDATRSVPVELLRACIVGDCENARRLWPQLQEAWQSVGILYVPLNRGGSPKTIVETRSRQQLIQNLMLWLPRLGLLNETYELIDLVRAMEATPVGPGAITEFDDLFDVACRALVSALIDCKEANAHDDDLDGDEWLVSCVEEMMEPLLRSWLEHSRTLRLSVLEQVMDDGAWQELVEFIRQFGRDVFTQRFLHLGNIRGILHQGVDNWLDKLKEYGDEDQYGTLLDALDAELDREEAVDKFTFILEAIVESYSEYRDYNSTTTQSDQGDLLYSLLDFLRLRVSYDRVVWNLNPVIVAHQVLADRRCEKAAELWRASLEERIGPESRRHMVRLQALQKKYAMTLPSVAKRLSEKFMRPLLIDHICSLVGPATSDDQEERTNAFERIKEQADKFLSEPSGAGLDVPTWLLSMEEAVRAAYLEKNASMQELMEQRMQPTVTLTIEQIQTQIRSWMETDD